jgi:hypothetical protein
MGSVSEIVRPVSYNDAPALQAQVAALTVERDRLRAQVEATETREIGRPQAVRGLTVEQARFLLEEALSEYGDFWTWAIQSPEPIPTLYRQTLESLRAIVGRADEGEGGGA